MPISYLELERRMLGGRTGPRLTWVWTQPSVMYWSVHNARRGYMIETKMAHLARNTTVTTSARVVCVLDGMKAGVARVRRRFIKNDPLGTLRLGPRTANDRLKDLVFFWEHLRWLPNSVIHYLTQRAVNDSPRKALEAISDDLLHKGTWDPRILADVLVDMVSSYVAVLDAQGPWANAGEIQNTLDTMMRMIDVCHATNRQVDESDIEPVETLLNLLGW